MPGRKNQELIRAVRTMLHESASKKPFHSLVCQALQGKEFVEGSEFINQTLTERVFWLLRRAAEDHPAAQHMDLHFEYLTQARRLQVKNWREAGWGELQTSAGKTIEKNPLTAVHQELGKGVAMSLKELEKGEFVQYLGPHRSLLKKRPSV